MMEHFQFKKDSPSQQSVLGSYEDGNNSLLLAVKKGNLRMVKLLLRHPQIDPNQINADGDSPLMLAIINCRLDLVCAILKHPKTDPNQPNVVGHKPLVIAFNKCKVDLICAILMHKKIDFDQGMRNTLNLIATVMGRLDLFHEVMRYEKIIHEDLFSPLTDADSCLVMVRNLLNQEETDEDFEQYLHLVRKVKTQWEQEESEDESEEEEEEKEKEEKEEKETEDVCNENVLQYTENKITTLAKTNVLFCRSEITKGENNENKRGIKRKSCTDTPPMVIRGL